MQFVLTSKFIMLKEHIAKRNKMNSVIFFFVEIKKMWSSESLRKLWQIFFLNINEHI